MYILFGQMDMATTLDIVKEIKTYCIMSWLTSIFFGLYEANLSGLSFDEPNSL